MDDAATHRWDLTDIYPSEDEWRAAKADVERRMGSISSFRGKLGEDAHRLGDCLDTVFDIGKQLRRVGAYASMRSDEDTREALALEMRQAAVMLATRFSQETSFIDPEILQLGSQRVHELLAREPGLAPYRHLLDDILRRQPHTLGAEAEAVIATAGLMADGPAAAHSILTNAEMPWPTVELSDGSRARLDQAGYSRFRALPQRQDRRRVFDAFWSTWEAYQRTCGVMLNSQVKRDLFYSQARRYPSTLAAALDGDHVPEAVYTTLIAQANDGLPTLHRYFRLRGRMLDVDDLRYYDIYPPLVSSDLSFPIERAEELVPEALAPLGADYVAIVRRGLGSRWMDTFPRPGKRSGAYSSGSVYDEHPFVLMNYNGNYESVATLAHEWGHAMHSHLANAAQPYPTAEYSIFVAEVASTFNEALLLEHMLSTAADDNERLYYLGSALEGLRGTFFRQAMFAEFELEIHRHVESGEALSGERFSEVYGRLLRRYHGHDEGVLRIDDAYTVEWAYIPHFYSSFYVYQYATSIAAASLLAADVLEGRRGARERYLGLLEAGGSDYPYELLKRAGVDLATSAPYEALTRRMNGIMDEIEAILERR